MATHVKRASDQRPYFSIEEEPLNIGLSIKIARLVECFQCLHLLTKFHCHPLSGTCQWHWKRAFSLTWPTAMRIYRNKGTFCAHEEVQLPQDWSGTPTWSPFFWGGGHQYGERDCCHVKKLFDASSGLLFLK